MDAKIISLEQALADAVQLAKDFGVGKLYLIGSAATLPWDKLNDLDFAIDEIFPGKFFKFYGALLKSMPKPVDLINLTGEKSKFTDLIISEGRLLYERSKN